jgi:hypothetical protein
MILYARNKGVTLSDTERRTARVTVLKKEEVKAKK